MHMKKYRVLLSMVCGSLLLYGSQPLMAQRSDYKVIFDLTSKDSIDQKNLVRWLTEISSNNPDAKLEVVMYSKGLEMVVKGKSAVAEEISRLSANKNISFQVCEIAMKNNQIEPGQLLAGVGMVPDGIYEIMRKQKEGWGYIKAAR
jgi:intracellular sulfur oxidation DsrE/DsrF family protein